MSLSYQEEITERQQAPLGLVKAQLHHCRMPLHGLLEGAHKVL
jgi:hypothetical protein